MHRRAFDHALPTLAGLHTPQDDRRFFRDRVFAACNIWGAFERDLMNGIIAFRRTGSINYTSCRRWQGRGFGTSLLLIAQDAFDCLNLWTFQRNVKARRFYEARGFALVRKTDGSGNEEKEPDALYRWEKIREATLFPRSKLP